MVTRRLDGFSREALEAIRDYPWPGNVRELRNAISEALTATDEPRIEPSDFPIEMRNWPTPELREKERETSVVQLPASLAHLEERGVEAAMKATGGNQVKAAALLGIGRNTLAAKLKAYQRRD